MSRSRPSIFQFHDYREYLRAYLAFIRQSRRLSLRHLAKAVGVSHGYFSLVLNRDRNLATKLIAGLATALAWTDEETRFFENLVVLADAPDAETRNRAFAALQASDGFRENYPKEFETFRYLESWVNVVIRELTLVEGFNSDPRWIQSQLSFPVTIRQIEESLRFLWEHGLLKLEPDGGLIPADRDLTCLGGVYQLSLGNFHRGMLDLAKSSLERYRASQREQIGYTMALSRDDFGKIREILADAKERIKEIERKSRARGPDTVYHVNFSAFPVAGKGGRHEDDV